MRTSAAAVLTRAEPAERDRDPDMRPLNWRIIVRLLRYTRPYRRQRNLLFGLVLLRAAQLTLLAWTIASVAGGPVSRLDTRGVLLGAGGYLLLAWFTGLTMRYRIRLALELGENVIHDLRRDMFEHLQGMSMSYFQRNKIGRIISRFTSDAEVVRAGIQDVLFVSLVQGGTLLVACGLMLYYDAGLFLVLSSVIPIGWLLNRRFRRRMSEAYRAAQESFSRLTATLAESINGVRVTQVFAREDVNAGLFRAQVADHARCNIDGARASGVFGPLMDISTQLVVAVVLLFGGWRVFHGRTRVEDLYQFLLMAGMIYGPVQALAGMYNQALIAMAGAERIFRFLDTAPEWVDPPDARRPAAMEGRVRFENVGFAYEPGRPVLREVAFEADPGRTVALVGPTGSGKSTIVNLLARFYRPTSGVVRVDGHDLGVLDDRWLHKRMGIVLQQNFLFTGTVMENIRIGRPEATDREIVAAAERLDCRDLIEDMPGGFGGAIGEGGAGVSLGQRQLICFVRALLADPRILLLDEATSSVDTMTEVRVQKALYLLLQSRTSLVIAHRLSTIRHADLVLVMNEGRLVERGTHEGLLRERGLYARLYRDFVASADA